MTLEFSNVAMETVQKKQSFENSSNLYETLQKCSLVNLDAAFNFGISKMAAVTMAAV